MTWAAQFVAARGCLPLGEAAAAIYTVRDITRTVEDWESGRRQPPDWVQPLVLAVLRLAAFSARKKSK